jgi:hypothetical protein
MCHCANVATTTKITVGWTEEESSSWRSWSGGTQLHMLKSKFKTVRGRYVSPVPCTWWSKHAEPCQTDLLSEIVTLPTNITRAEPVPPSGINIGTGWQWVLHLTAVFPAHSHGFTTLQPIYHFVGRVSNGSRLQKNSSRKPVPTVSEHLDPKW